jgi:sulfofructose kinase
MEDRLDIVGLGLATLDVLIRLREMPTWENGSPFSAFTIDGGGPVGTACVAASRLGARTGFIGTAGNDRIAALKLQSFTESGVDLSRMVLRDQPESQVVIVYVNEGTGERIFSGLKAFDNAPLSAAELDRAYITSAEYLHLDGFLHAEASLAAAQWMRSAGKKVSLDGSKTDGGPLPPHMAQLVSLVDILICGAGFGLSLTGKADVWEAGEAMARLGPQVVVQTEGAEGCYTVAAKERFHTPAFAVEVVDTTGAGDVFHGAYLAGLLRGWNLRTTALFAGAVAAIKCTKLGGRSGIPRFDEVFAFLHERGFDI